MFSWLFLLACFLAALFVVVVVVVVLLSWLLFVLLVFFGLHFMCVFFKRLAVSRIIRPLVTLVDTMTTALTAEGIRSSNHVQGSWAWLRALLSVCPHALLCLHLAA